MPALPLRLQEQSQRFLHPCLHPAARCCCPGPCGHPASVTGSWRGSQCTHKIQEDACALRGRRGQRPWRWRGCWRRAGIRVQPALVTWSLPLVAVPAGSSHSPEPDEPLRAPCRPCAATHHTVGLIVQRPRTQAAACLELLAGHARAPCNWWEQFVASQAWPDYPKSKQLNSLRAQLDEVSVGVYYLPVCVAVCLCAAYVLHDCACRLVCVRACALWSGLLGHHRVM